MDDYQEDLPEHWIEIQFKFVWKCMVVVYLVLQKAPIQPLKKYYKRIF